MNAYRDASVDLAPKRLYPALLWGGIVRCLVLAGRARDRRDIPERHNMLMRAQQIVSALDRAIRDDLIPTWAKELHTVHARMLYLLVQANVRNSAEFLAEAKGLAMQMEDLWRQAAAKAGDVFGEEGAALREEAEA